jgi:hypothetical protein
VEGRTRPQAKEQSLSKLTNNSSLRFAITLIDGKTIETVGQAAEYFAELTLDQREQGYWQAAIRMLNNALEEPTYLKAATMSLQTGLLMDQVLESPLTVGGEAQ